MKHNFESRDEEKLTSERISLLALLKPFFANAVTQTRRMTVLLKNANGLKPGKFPDYQFSYKDY